MNIDYAATLLTLKTIPEQDGKTDICKAVAWQIKFFDTTYPDSVLSIAEIETVLNTDTLPENFVEYSQLTHQQILQWTLDHEGGTDFLSELMRYHEGELLRQFDQAGLEIKDIEGIAEQ
ncbi:MAG: hypothetical protein KJO69_06940 [Gammaproteobacteria bacterium]|nr:hypothetical protein [Gammaproteobacteria bacterium]